jgi:AcrR family transcriptional regulator
MGRRTFLAAERLDMSALAEALGINRVTLYRWVGSRDHLLVEVIWSLADRALQEANRRAGGRGPQRVVAVLTGFLDLVIANPGMQRWLAEDGEHAMRLLTRREPGFQPRLINAIRQILQAEADVGSLDIPVTVDELAYALVRLIESYTYLDLITGEPAEARRAEPIFRMLLGADSPTHAHAPSKS